MQKGMNQTIAWLVAVFSTSAVFSVGLFLVSKYHPDTEAPEQHMSAKALESHEKTRNTSDVKHKKKKSAEVQEAKHKPAKEEKGEEVLRPDDLDH